ncbi:MAG: CBS domain-containing protein [Acidimicrobiia bacterium]|nr:CBS domain-containing protein [Acidimicrobiia bacterium]
MDVDAKAPVRRIVQAEPVSVDERMTLNSLAAVLAARGIGVALVRRADGGLGIVSERDVTRALADAADPDAVWAADVMTEDLVTVDADDRVVDAALRLIDEDIRHAVVVDGDEVLGVVSARDLFRIVTEELLDSW